MSLFDIVLLEKQLKELENETLKEEFWQKAPNETAKILAQIKQFKGKVESYKNITNEISSLQELTELANVENDEDVAKEILKTTESLEIDI